MVFLSPIILLGLLAAAIPIAIHLIRREKPPKLMFGSIRFLKKTSRKLILFQHLQQWFLLLLRALLVALLVIAFARPLVDRTVAELLDGDPQSAVILLDASMSMQYEDNFAAAKQQALSMMSDMEAGDEVALIVFSGSMETVRELNSDLDIVRNEIAATDNAGYGGTAYLPALQQANQLLETSRYDNRRIYLISDFQASGFARDTVDFKLAPGVILTGIDVGSDESVNLALTDVRSPEQLLEDDEEQSVLVRVRSTGTVFMERGEISLLVNDEEVDRQAVELLNRSEQIITFNTSFPSEGTYTGEVRLGGDNFLADNSYLFTVDVLPKIEVLVVNGEASDNWFDDEGHWFGLAVAGGATSPFLLQSITPQELSAAALAQHDVVVLLNVGNLNTSQTEAIVRYVTDGGKVLFAPGDRVQPEVFNRQFAAIAPASLQSLGMLGRNDYLVIGDYDRRHPILRPLDSIWAARFQGRWLLTPNPDAEVLMQFDSAEPALLERDAGTGKAILFASSLDLEWNNLALQELYLPFVHQTLRYMAQAGNESGNEQTGNTILLPEESNLARMPFSSLYDAVINPDTNPVQTREARTAMLAEELERPQRLWWWILSLTALLLLAEALIANRTYR
ncbi:MAG: BatA domain-containing protein [Pseudohongiellaceae bacterium]